MINNFKLYEGDCLEILKYIPNDSVDLIVTDPPYDIKNTSPGGNSNFAKSLQNMNNQIKTKNLTTGFDITILEELVRVCKNINMYFFCNKSQLPLYFDYFVTNKKCSFDLIKWVKTNAPPTFNNKYLSDTEYCFYARKSAYCNPGSYVDASTLYHAPINQKDKKIWGHPTIKPIQLLERIIKNSSKGDDLILDPFMGSGSTGVTCCNLKRKFIGIELDSDFFKIAQGRIGQAIVDNI